MQLALLSKLVKAGWSDPDLHRDLHRGTTVLEFNTIKSNPLVNLRDCLRLHEVFLTMRRHELHIPEHVEDATQGFVAARIIVHGKSDDTLIFLARSCVEAQGHHILQILRDTLDERAKAEKFERHLRIVA